MHSCETSIDLSLDHCSSPYRDPHFESLVASCNAYLHRSSSSHVVEPRSESHLLRDAVSSGHQPQFRHHSQYDPEYESNLAFQSRPFTQCASELFTQVFDNKVFKQANKQQAQEKLQRERPLYEKYRLPIDQSITPTTSISLNNHSAALNPHISKEQQQINALHRDLAHTRQSIDQLTDAASETKQRYHIKPAQRKQWTTIFHSINVSKSGFINHSELKKAFQTIAIKLSNIDIANLLQIIDQNHDHRISLPEFIAALANNTNEWESISTLRHEQTSMASKPLKSSKSNSTNKSSTRVGSRPMTAPNKSVDAVNHSQEKTTKAPANVLLPVSLWAPAWARRSNIDSIIHRKSSDKSRRTHPISAGARSHADMSPSLSDQHDDCDIESELVSDSSNRQTTLNERWNEVQEQVLSMRIGREMVSAQALNDRSQTATSLSMPDRTHRERRFMSAINQCVASSSRQVKIIGFKPIDLDDVPDTQSETSSDDPCMLENDMVCAVSDILSECDTVINQSRSMQFGV